jgi:hypothetical protein
LSVMTAKSTPLSDVVKSTVRHPARCLPSDRHLHSCHMSLADNQAIRKANFQALRDKHGSKDIQERLGWSKQQFSQYVGNSQNPRPITDAVARRVERVYDLPNAWMDYPHYETEVLLQNVVNFIRSQPTDRQKVLLQLVELAIKVGSDPTDKP